MYVISIYFQKLASSIDIEFQSSHPKYHTYVQQHFTKSESYAKVKLLRLLFDNDGFSNIIPVDDPETAEDYNNIAVILLVLFVPQNCLQSLFVDIGAINNNDL